ncbi:MAG: hypothetical protein QXS91_02365 [Candidatus Anstonellales archaeon]
MIKGKSGEEILANKDEKIINEAVAIMLNPVFFNNLPDKKELIGVIK